MKSNLLHSFIHSIQIHEKKTRKIEKISTKMNSFDLHEQIQEWDMSGSFEGELQDGIYL